MRRIIRATSWENLLLPYANNKGTDQSAHPRSLINTFVVHCLDSIMPLVSISEISSLYLASLAAQAGFCLTWSQPRRGFLVTMLIKEMYIFSVHWADLKTHHLYKSRFLSEKIMFIKFWNFRQGKHLFVHNPCKNGSGRTTRKRYLTQKCDTHQIRICIARGHFQSNFRQVII